MLEVLSVVYLLFLLEQVVLLIKVYNKMGCSWNMFYVAIIPNYSGNQP